MKEDTIAIHYKPRQECGQWSEYTQGDTCTECGMPLTIKAEQAKPIADFFRIPYGSMGEEVTA